MALDTYAFGIVAAITLISAVLVFVERKLIHAVIALSVAFLGSALLFFLIGQTLPALLQLVVFVGGFSTYLIVAVATEEKRANLVSFRNFLVLSLILSVGIGVFLLRYLPVSNTNLATNFLNVSASSFEQYYAVFYLMLLLLFAVSISSVLIIRKFSRLVV
jgi:NADH:ubiquinone oxidoreductase subunit 6 (subunit J)